jgi:hypothetical protein
MQLGAAGHVKSRRNDASGFPFNLITSGNAHSQPGFQTVRLRISVLMQGTDRVARARADMRKSGMLNGSLFADSTSEDNGPTGVTLPLYSLS